VSLDAESLRVNYDGKQKIFAERILKSKTLYISGIYLVDKTSSGTVTQTRTHYPAAGAMGIGGTLYFMLKDRLGSASVLTNAIGNAVSGADTRYYPFGEARSSTTSMLTDKLFTGQREITDLGIYYYRARFYSLYINCFLCADTIVPRYANPQSLNRYSYVNNNPLRYIDPTGHRPDDGYVGNHNSTNCTKYPQYCNNNNNNDAPDHNKDDADQNDDDGAGGCVPSLGQWLCDLDSLPQESSRLYTLTNVVWPASRHCTQQEMIYYFSLFAYPGQDYSIKPPFGSFPKGSDLYNLGLIHVSSRNGSLISFNTTMKSHIFCCGTVQRTLTQNASSAWSVTFVEAGSNANSFMAGVNQRLGPQLFQDLDFSYRHVEI
jgi:RHS repeat-associated protein